MNPEFHRNLWLELNTRRMTLAAALLALAFLAAALSGGSSVRPAAVARFVYYLVVVLWGARNAALSVVGEIRDRTWDGQRLSALTPGEMVWGKLFGCTIYNWYVGALCLAMIVAQQIADRGFFAALIDAVYFLEIGVIAQAAALLASLVAVQRRQSHSRAEIFVYQLAGILAAIAVYAVWSTADPAGSILIGKTPTLFIAWWGHAFDARGFLLVSLALFTGWILTGCYREMRLELKMENGPRVWLGFLAFIGIYVAGFDNWLSQSPEMAGWSAFALRLGLAASTFATLTYLMVFLEPKDRVHLRWLGAQIAARRFARAFEGLEGFMMSYLAMAFLTLVLICWRWAEGAGGSGELALIAAGLAFITRDVALFALVHALPGRRRGDFSAVMALLVLYLLIPAILRGLGVDGALVLFYPRRLDPSWLSPLFAWAEAAIMIALALGRIALAEVPAERDAAAD